MPVPTPFHERTVERCKSLLWKDWAGYHAVRAYDTYAEREYFAFRHAAGLIDVSPLFKYDVTGKDAGPFLSRILAKGVSKMKRGRVTYGCWCDDDGKVIDDGTVWRLARDRYRVTSAEPSLAWFLENARGLEVRVEDVTDSIAALSLQGPTSREILGRACDADLRGLRYFRLTETRFDGFEAVVTRTGYSGDLGYEIWVNRTDALRLWDVITDAGRDLGVEPAGLDAYDMVRVEAGYIMNGVDYYSANHCLIESRKSSPFEAGLERTVKLDREPFNGQAALRREHDAGPRRRLVGLEVDWDDFERLFRAHGLPPDPGSGAWRDPRPVYAVSGTQIGQATSGSWSPLLKRNLALATVDATCAAPGTELRLEATVEYVRHPVKAVVRDRPFYDPPRKTS